MLALCVARFASRALRRALCVARFASWHLTCLRCPRLVTRRAHKGRRALSWALGGVRGALHWGGVGGVSELARRRGRVARAYETHATSRLPPPRTRRTK